MTVRVPANANHGRKLQDQVARRLVADGYDVILAPGRDHLPAELVQLRPDLLGLRGDERLLVEIKTETGAAAAEHSKELARLVSGRPNWHFELVLAAPDPATEIAGTEWTTAELAGRADEADALARAGHPEAALLLAFATAEAAARALAAAEQVDVQRWNPPAMFRQLVHEGLLDRDTLPGIEAARRARNRLAHGLPAEADLAAAVASLSAATRAMLAEIGTTATRQLG